MGSKQVLPYSPSLGKVGADDVISGKVLPYYGTNFGTLLVLASGNIVLPLRSVG
jgi:hypothetical protein